MASALVQPFPALDAATEAALRASIARFGVLVPVVHDQDGRTLDGHHRSRLADELGVPYRIDVREVADEDEAREIARTLNADRRHLTPEQRRQAVIALREDGHSYRAIAGALGIDRQTAYRDTSESGVTRVTPERTVGQDGKSYPASRPQPDPPTTHSRRPRREDRTASFEITNPRGRIDADANKRRLVDGVSQINGLCHGLGALDYGKAVAAMTPDEVRTWVKQVTDLVAALRLIKTNLQEASRNGEHSQ